MPIISRTQNAKTKRAHIKPNLKLITCLKVQLLIIKLLKLASLNIRSLSGKLFLIIDSITEHNVHALFLSEPWLDVNDETSSLIEYTPPNYIF